MKLKNIRFYIIRKLILKIDIIFKRCAQVQIFPVPYIFPSMSNSKLGPFDRPRVRGATKAIKAEVVPGINSCKTALRGAVCSVPRRGQVLSRVSE